jgi:DnaK suppressor protein
LTFPHYAGYTFESTPQFLPLASLQLSGVNLRLKQFDSIIRQINGSDGIMKTGSKSKSAAYRKVLERKAEEVRRSMSAQKAAQVVARLDCPSDEGDLSQQHHEEWIFLNRNTIDVKLLREIGDALHRIEHNSYGICMECEEPISAKRLDAVPWARYCVSCQESIAARIASGEFVDEFQESAR